MLSNFLCSFLRIRLSWTATYHSQGVYLSPKCYNRQVDPMTALLESAYLKTSTRDAGPQDPGPPLVPSGTCSHGMSKSQTTVTQQTTQHGAANRSHLIEPPTQIPYRPDLNSQPALTHPFSNHPGHHNQKPSLTSSRAQMLPTDCDPRPYARDRKLL